MESAAITSASYALSSLPLRPQLFLWTIRHLVLAARCERTLCAHAKKTFEIAKIPTFPSVIEELLHTFAQHATRCIEFNHPSSTELLPDERQFLACLQALMKNPSECGGRHLYGMLDPHGIDDVMPHFAQAADTLQSCQPMQFGMPIHQPIGSLSASASLH